MKLMKRLRASLSMPARNVLNKITNFFANYFGSVERNLTRTCRNVNRYTRPRFSAC